MSIFMIETDSANSVSSSLDNLASQMENIAGNVEGYDTSCEDFDFAGAKSVLANSIKACATKIKNTRNVIESVVTSHTSFQNNNKFESSEEKAQREQQQRKVGTNNGGNNSGGNSGGYSGGSSSGGGGSYSGGGYTGGGSTGGGTVTQQQTPVTTAPTEAPTEAPTTPKTEKKTEITDYKIEKISHQVLDESKITADAKSIFDNVKYNDEGYAIYNGMMVIACAAGLGKVGDIIEIATKDGKTMKCIVGINDDSLKNEVSFITNDKWKEENSNNISEKLPEQIDKIYKVESEIQARIGENTFVWEKLDGKWNAVKTVGNLDEYVKKIEGKISQNANKEEFRDKCLSFAETHAYALYTGKMDDTAQKASTYPHSGAFTSFKTDSKEEALNKIYTEITSGRPVVVQVNGNKKGTSRHFVTVIGFNSNVTEASKLTEKDLLIIDSYDGKVERMDTENSRFLTTGKDTHKSYTGYYLRVLKPKDEKTNNENKKDNTNKTNNETVAV